MKKIININLSGRVIPIEDAAYESLQRYIDSLRRFFAHEEGRDEIINDIESRIAELMNDKVRKGAPAITDADVEEIIASMGRVEDFEQVEGETAAAAGAATGTAAGAAASQAAPKSGKGRLYRDASDKLLGGVCSGIANYMNFDPAIVRLLFAIITFGGFGMGILLYILLWIILPAKDLDTYVGKRLFRNPDDKIISGVAGGLGAYFNKPSWVIRLIFASPLLLNVLFSVFNGIFFAFERDIFPNIVIAPFTGTFILTYIILWMVLPEARSSFEKMEMRGEKVDVNRIRQNVKDEMENFKTRAQGWSEEVRTSAQQFSKRATEFANTRGKAWAGEVAETARPVANGLGHVIGVLFKAFFIFIAGCLALVIFAALMALIFGGVAWWPINNFLWSSSYQQMLAWGTLLFFFTVPVIAFITWLVRRLIRVRSRNRYLGWTFGGLWTIGWFCAILFAISISKDLRAYERVSEQTRMAQPGNKLVVRVNEPEVRYSGDFSWIRSDDNRGWDITENMMKYNNVKVRVQKSEDSLYKITTYKYSAGKSISDAQGRASRTGFNVSVQDSILNIGSGLTITRASKFRGQGVVVEIQIPVGKGIRFDPSLSNAYNPWVVRRRDADYDRDWGRRHRYDFDWDDNEYIDWDPNVDYIMTAEGRLVRADRALATEPAGNSDSSRAVSDSLRRRIEERERQLRQDRERLEEMERRRDERTSAAGQKKEEHAVMLFSPLLPMII